MSRKLLVLSVPLVMLASPAAAFAESDSVPVGQTALGGLALWALGVGALVPLVTYVLNRYVSTEPIRATILLVVAAIAGALTQLINSGSIGLDTATLRYVISAVLAALTAHHLLYKPGLVNATLGHPDHGGRVARHHTADRA